jgi:RHS repeat-associated protein
MRIGNACLVRDGWQWRWHEGLKLRQGQMAVFDRANQGSMAHLYRLIVVSVLLLASCWANASVPAVPQWNYGNVAKTFSTPEAACQAYLGIVFAGIATYDHVEVISAQADGCYMKSNSGGIVSKATDVSWSTSSCPAHTTGTTSCTCNSGFQENGSRTACLVAAPEPSSLRSCKRPVDGVVKGAPILPATGEKYRFELDYADSGPSALSFTRTYRSTWSSDPARSGNPLGQVWAHNYGTSLTATPSTAPTTVAITSGEGYLRTFFQATGSFNWDATNSADTLVQTAVGAWTYHRSDDDTTFNFDAAGKLQTTVERNGWATAYTYTAVGQLATVTNGFGRTLSLAYNTAGQLVTVTTPDGRVIGYSYDASGRLALVTYPDGKARNFLYEITAFPQALTGILDETGARWGTFEYDSAGRATSTQLAGSADRYQVSYPSAGAATVIDPLGTIRNYSYGTTKGKLAVTGGSLPSGNGESDAATRVQDANGLITSETDFKGVTTTTTWDVARRLPISVTRTAGMPEAQTVTTQWHSTFALPVLITEIGRTIVYTYDSSGNVLSQAITDTASSPNTTRTWQWTYNPQGLAATQTAPNGAVTTYTYDTLGNLTKAVNTLGHETLYAYGMANRVVSSTTPNGLVTTYTYDARDRLLTRTFGGQQTTTLTYNPTGTVATLTLPTGLTLNYTYDAAHRLTGWSNNRGESGTFTLDGMGNRTAEQIKNSAGAVAWIAARSINNLNRVSARTDGPNQTNAFGYDANGELVSEANGLNESTQYGLDGLRRVSAITNASSATATLAYNALDGVTAATDFKGVATTYNRDAKGNATSESSADIGSVSTQYDALGLPSQIVDALGQATTITRDALGRPVGLLFADGKTTTLRYDLTPTSKGYLSEIVDRSGTIEYTRDAFGRVTAKRQSLASGLVQQVSYAYGASGLLASIGYPNGSVLSYVYDATGRLAQLNWNGNPLITNIAWNPMGQATSWSWAFASPSLAASRSYDTAGRLTATEFSGYVWDAAGRITSLTQNLYQPVDADPTHSTIASANVSWTVGYDAVGRITGFNATGNATGFGYDANGNRASSTKTLNGQTTGRSYTVGASSNRLTGFSQTLAGTTTNVAYAYNANGDMTSDGLRTYSYDAEGRLSAVTTGATDTSPTTRYAHNALGQRVFKTEALYPPVEGDESDPGFFQSLIDFFTKLWGPATTDAEKLGFAFVYDEDGTLIAETGTGGANSTGATQYIHLPTANGPMPIAAVINGTKYAVHSDHLNTPRRMTDESGQAVWQWSYSAFGDEKPTIAKNRFANLDVNPNPGTTSVAEVTNNERYPGQYFDKESGLHYNYFRSYDSRTGRYSQPDLIGLDGGWNRYPYANLNLLKYTDPMGLMGVGSGVYGVPSGEPTEGPTFSITKSGVCDGADAMCAPAMEAAGLKGPYFSETKKYSVSCLATMGIAVKGGGAVLGNAAAKQAPRAAEALGAGARTMGLIGRGVTLFTNPVLTGGSLGFAVPALLEHCEIKEPPICLAGGR